MFEDYSILNGSEISKYNQNSEKFKSSVIKVTTLNGTPLYLVPKSFKEDYGDTIFKELLDHYDFNKVSAIMHKLDWTWYGEETPPSVQDMKEGVSSLYESIRHRILNNEYCYACSGGFKLEYLPEENKELRLVFEAVEYSVFGDDDFS